MAHRQTYDWPHSAKDTSLFRDIGVGGLLQGLVVVFKFSLLGPLGVACLPLLGPTGFESFVMLPICGYG